jgi:hypothetical protein
MPLQGLQRGIPRISSELSHVRKKEMEWQLKKAGLARQHRTAAHRLGALDAVNRNAFETRAFVKKALEVAAARKQQGRILTGSSGGSRDWAGRLRCLLRGVHSPGGSALGSRM